MIVVLEIQTTDTVATLVNSYMDRQEAESKYHAILAAAATSKLPKHSAVMLTSDGYYIKSECYEHDTEEK